jgi:uncharacterized protein YjbI with pentapeptide repeats
VQRWHRQQAGAGRDTRQVERRGAHDADVWDKPGYSDFCGATLKKTSARRANVGQAECDDAVLVGARFDGASITSTSLRRADAKYASFKGARLQSAHFDRADLRGARFEGANLTDTYFFGARLDQGALQSILRTPYWRHAHFDSDVFDRLRVLSQSAVAASD